MRYLSDDSNDQNPVWVSSVEMQSPKTFLKSFLKDYTVADCRFFLWQMLSASISSDNQHADASPGEQICFFENLMPFIECAFLVCENDDLDTGDQTSEKEGHGSSVAVGPDATTASANSASIKSDKTRRKIERRVRRGSLWYREKITDPYDVIKTFFCAYDVLAFETNSSKSCSLAQMKNSTRLAVRQMCCIYLKN